jgi:hypothetical protein
MNNTPHWTLLSDYANRRKRFDPSDMSDLKELGYFKKHGNWKSGCPFHLEWPFQDVVTMCQSKYTDHMLSKLANKKAP